MRRALWLAAILVALAPTLATAGGRIGVGVFGGASFPIVQDDVGTGSTYGARVPVEVLPLITIEPYFAGSAMGEGEATLDGETYTRDGFDMTAFGGNVMLGSPSSPGFQLLPYVGIGYNHLTRAGSADIDEVGFNFGLGVGFAVLKKLSLQARGELNMVVTGDTSRKFGNLTVGVNYNLLKF
jgi:opacity protein-like surface antigen